MANIGIGNEVRMSCDVEIKLSPGGQKVLVKKIMDEFCPRFTPNAKLRPEMGKLFNP